MRRLIFIYLILTGSFCLYGQETINVDSVVKAHVQLTKACRLAEQSGNHDQAILFATQDVDLLRYYCGENSNHFLDALKFLGFLYAGGKDYHNSILVFADLMDISSKNLPQFENYYLDAGTMHSKLCYLSKRYNDCEDTSLSLLKYIQEHEVENKLELTLESIKYIGLCYSKQGEFLRAIEFFKLISNNSPSVDVYAESMRWLASNYSKIGDNINAQSIAGKAYNTLIENKYSDYKLPTDLLIDLANYNYCLQDYDKAIECIKKAEYKIFQYGEKELDASYADCCFVKALLYFSLNELDKAIESASAAYANYMRATSMNSPSTINVLNLLSLIYASTSDTKHAVELAELAHSCAYLGDSINNYNHYIEDNKHLCYAYYRNKDYDKMVKCAYEYIANAGRFLYKNFRLSRDYERMLMWQSEISDIVYDLPLKMDVIKNFNNKTLLGKCLYDIALIKKGLLLFSDIQIKRLLQKEENQAVLNSIDSLLNLKNNSPYKNREINKEIDELYSILRLRNQNNQALEHFLTMSWRDVQENMNKNDISIEFLLSSDSTIIANCLRKEWSEPKYIVLCKREDISKLTNNINNLYNSTIIWDKIWKKIFELVDIDSEDNVYFSPIDVLSQINIELAIDDSNQLISEKYNIIRISSTKNIHKGNSNDVHIPLTCVLYGGLNYECDVNFINTSEESNTIIDSLRIERGRFDYLPGTQKEVDSIETIILASGIPLESVQKYQDNNGTELSFRKLSENVPQILHLSTHSYYIKPSEEEMKKYIMTEEEKLIQLNNFNNPDMINYGLNRTGLLLSGAKKTLEQKTINTTNDGILTAKEISNIDLNGTSLVVLSSCQSGLGTMTSDGISGLQRGFKMAGVNTIIMSLWNVDDIATSFMMTHFYQELLRTGSKHDAFRFAQRKVKEKYDNPYYWASFIMID
ncbi:MAG: CHAT domain-containing protein [Prevotella sp.]|nr:CHAT domain-containing protein [Prevotella sp.]